MRRMVGCGRTIEQATLPGLSKMGLRKMKDTAEFLDVHVSLAAGEEERAIVFEVIVPENNCFVRPSGIVLR